MTSPLIHLIPVTSLSQKGRAIVVKATADELVNIAKDCGLDAIETFKAEFQVTKGGGPLIAVQGRVLADVVQTCGVTLAPVEAHVEGDIALLFTLDPVKSRAEVDVDPNDEDPPEPVIDGQIDFGALALEHLVLNLDPYPRAPDAAFQANNQHAQEVELAEEDGKRENPFAVLSTLKTGPSQH